MIDEPHGDKESFGSCAIIHQAGGTRRKVIRVLRAGIF